MPPTNVSQVAKGYWSIVKAIRKGDFGFLPTLESMCHNTDESVRKRAQTAYAELVALQETETG